MSRIAFSKSELTRQNQRLKGYQEFLPALDLKRQALLVEQLKARQELEEEYKQLSALMTKVVEQLPMLADDRIDLHSLIEIETVIIEEENVMGVKVPSFENIEFDIKAYAFLGKPHWVDLLVDYLKEALELHARIQVSEQRLQIIKEAVRIVTQRVNLFEKVLIPRTRENIKKIHIYLSDQERAGVVRAKLAKRKKIKTG